MSRPGDSVRVAWTVVKRAHAHDVKYPAASLAYYGFVSLFPLLVLALAVLSRPEAAWIQRATPTFLSPATRQLVYEATANGAGREGATLLAVAVLLWSGANVTVGFRSAVERAEGGVASSLAGRLRDGVCILGSLVLAVAVIVATSALFSIFPTGRVVEAATLAALLAALTVVFLPLYYAPSRRVTSLRGALPGAVTAAVCWTSMLAVVHVYAVNADRYAVYGVVSGIVIVLTSLYVGALVLLVGVVVNATVAE
ncbi:membrane protein [Halogeometricum rufum]|jgi:membrane protein|uniref:Membrane protein n=1 Tax=Halogeometricum rufum TaxID=553469 RepID=A0A1I6FXE3_9EURY|nr:YhjD/YihY/BrkB family envelope integrity protein [Halogeometricum rufum]SFR34632.1 membrane protein [Halogeometricum rufum]